MGRGRDRCKTCACCQLAQCRDLLFDSIVCSNVGVNLDKETTQLLVIHSCNRRTRQHRTEPARANCAQVPSAAHESFTWALACGQECGGGSAVLVGTGNGAKPSQTAVGRCDTVRRGQTALLRCCHLLYWYGRCLGVSKTLSLFRLLTRPADRRHCAPSIAQE